MANAGVDNNIANNEDEQPSDLNNAATQRLNDQIGVVAEQNEPAALVRNVPKKNKKNNRRRKKEFLAKYVEAKKAEDEKQTQEMKELIERNQELERTVVALKATIDYQAKQLAEARQLVYSHADTLLAVINR